VDRQPDEPADRLYVMTEPTPHPHLNVTMPQEKAGGQYADFASIWHTADQFVFDFAAMTAPPASATATDGQPAIVYEAQVVTRVRVPASQAIEIMKALGAQLDAWERETGRQ
jgi:hypothetical protein